jgi:hypothetical protein
MDPITGAVIIVGLQKVGGPASTVVTDASRRRSVESQQIPPVLVGFFGIPELSHWRVTVRLAVPSWRLEPRCVALPNIFRGNVPGNNMVGRGTQFVQRHEDKNKIFCEIDHLDLLVHHPLGFVPLFRFDLNPDTPGSVSIRSQNVDSTGIPKCEGGYVTPA